MKGIEKLNKYIKKEKELEKELISLSDKYEFLDALASDLGWSEEDDKDSDEWLEEKYDEDFSFASGEMLMACLSYREYEMETAEELIECILDVKNFPEFFISTSHSVETVEWDYDKISFEFYNGTSGYVHVKNGVLVTEFYD